MGSLAGSPCSVKERGELVADGARIELETFADGGEAEGMGAGEGLEPDAGIAAGAEVEGVGHLQIEDGAFDDSGLEAAFGEVVQAQGG